MPAIEYSSEKVIPGLQVTDFLIFLQKISMSDESLVVLGLKITVFFGIGNLHCVTKYTIDDFF